MAGHKKITAEEASRIWFLHKKGLKNTEIANVMGRSTNGVRNCVFVFDACERGDYSAAKAHCFGETTGNKKLLDLAYSFFGIKEEQEVEQTKPEQPQCDATPDNTLRYLCKFLEAQQRTNELLEKMCAEMGVKV